MKIRWTQAETQRRELVPCVRYLALPGGVDADVGQPGVTVSVGSAAGHAGLSDGSRATSASRS